MIYVFLLIFFIIVKLLTCHQPVSIFPNVVYLLIEFKCISQRSSSRLFNQMTAYKEAQMSSVVFLLRAAAAVPGV